MLDLSKFDILRESQPWYIYKRVQLTSPTGYFFEPIDYGFWYLLRRVHVQFPELDPAGAVTYPQLNMYMVERGSNKIPQNVPIPFRLFCTPGAEGVQVNAANQLTATGPKNVKLINKVFPYRDNIELYISGQNPIGSPAFIDIALVGYLIPSKSFYMWQKNEGGESGGTA